MPKLIKVIAVISTILIIGCASGPAEKSFDSAMGEWRYEFRGPDEILYTGRMTFVDEEKVTYPYLQGRVLFDAVDDQGKWEGYWVESDGGYGCAEKKDGSIHWGAVTFQFNDTYTQWKGEFDFCGEGKKYPWNGSR